MQKVIEDDSVKITIQEDDKGKEISRNTEVKPSKSFEERVEKVLREKGLIA